MVRVQVNAAGLAHVDNQRPCAQLGPAPVRMFHKQPTGIEPSSSRCAALRSGSSHRRWYTWCRAAVKQTALGDKPSTGCSTPVRPPLIAPPSAAVEQTALGSAAVKQTALGDKPSTVCSTAVRPRLTALGDKPSTVCSTAVRPRLTALGANLAPSVLRRCGPGRQHWAANLAPAVLRRCGPGRQHWETNLAPAVLRRCGPVCSTPVRPRLLPSRR